MAQGKKIPNGYTIENLMTSRDMKRVTKFSGKDIEFRPPTVFVDQLSRACALSNIQKMTGMEEMLDQEVYNSDSKMSAKQKMAMSVADEVLNKELETELIFRCTFIPGSQSDSFFFNSDVIRALSVDSFVQLQKELYEVLRFSPSASQVSSEDFEKMYKDFKKKDQITTIYSQEELMKFTVALVEKCEAETIEQQEKPS